MNKLIKLMNNGILVGCGGGGSENLSPQPPDLIEQDSILGNSDDITKPLITGTSNESVTWRISPNIQSELFNIDDKGNLTFKSAPSFDTLDGTNNKYIIDIVAKNSSHIESIQTITITVSSSELD